MLKDEIKKEIKQLNKDMVAIRMAYAVQMGLNLQFGQDVDENDKEKLLKKFNGIDVRTEYNSFYTRAIRLVKSILPERLFEFEQCYKNNNNKKDFTLSTYDISLGLTGMYKSFDGQNKYNSQTICLFDEQGAIINSILSIIDSKLFDIKGELQYNIFMEELNAAEYLLKNKYNRAAGMVAGVALESHLKSVCINHSISISSRDSLGDYNEKLKSDNIVDIAQWRRIQCLSDIRNVCGHKKEREPTEEEVRDLIIGTKKIVSEIL